MYPIEYIMCGARYITTAVYGSYDDLKVCTLRRFGAQSWQQYVH